MIGIRIFEEALQDLNEGFLFYEAQQRGLGYTVEDDRAVVWAVIDLRRDPAWIRNKLCE